jgi:hypothetical protein
MYDAAPTSAIDGCSNETFEGRRSSGAFFVDGEPLPSSSTLDNLGRDKHYALRGT